MANYAENRKARFDYEILETFEAGLALTGQEVKSIRFGRAQIAGSYVTFQREELYLVGANIPPYQPANAPSSYDPQRSRKLLLHSKEIKYLFGKSKERGLTLAPIRLYNKGAQIKLEFGVARGKKKYDKRETLKRRAAEREMRSFKYR